ncbi:MAG: branched-chain amino acid transaminase [Acidobacteria bacterium]|nr:branched-chain amino acid transaminase [Acidobacteriota bacterium]
MPFEGLSKIWMNGSFVDFEDAKVHVLSHVVHYGSGVFEGIRCYNTERGPEIFRLHDHIRRLYDSCRIYRMRPERSIEDFEQACIDSIVENDLKDCYIRPLVYRGFNTLGVDPRKCPIEMMIAVWKWGKYLGEDGIEKGVDVCVSSWNRMAPNTFPAMAKSTANYMNSQLIRMEAGVDGYEEGIALATDGYVSEGSGENIFIIRDGRIITPPLGASVLPGITRDSLMTLAKERGYQVTESRVPREMLYIADEMFFTGTAAEVTPIRSVDRIPVGNGARGPITEELQTAFFDYLNGRVEDRYGWMTSVYGRKDAAKDVVGAGSATA